MCSLIVVLFLLSVTQGEDICSPPLGGCQYGELLSPNYPKNYPSNRDCTFRCTAPSGSFFRISFKDINLEPDDDDNECHDKVQITDLGTGAKKEYCGPGIPADYKTKSNQVEIRFTSDSSTTNTGFRLIYRTEQNMLSDIDATSVCPGQEFNPKPEGGYLRSPKFGNNNNCKFTLRVPPGKKTHVEFLDFDMGDDNCLVAGLKISGSGAEITYCGKGKPVNRVFPGSKVYFHYTTSGPAADNIFLIKYYFTDDSTNDCVCPRGNHFIRVDLSKRKLNRDTDDIQFEFKTTKADSLLLYAMGKHRDFLLLKLVNGQISFSVDLGTGKGALTVPSAALNDDNWHKVEVDRNDRRVQILIDNGRYSGFFQTPGIFTKLDLRPPDAIMFVAGRQLNYANGHGPNFIGCLKNFIIDNRKSIAEALKGDPYHRFYGTYRTSVFPRCSGSN